MEKSIFTKPLFINPQAYFVIPELTTISKCVPYEFSSDSYSFIVNTNGIIDSKIINTNKETILHLDLILNTGNVVLGEWILDGDTEDLIVGQQSNIVTISYDFIKPIASYRSYDKTNEDEDRSVLKDLTGNGHDIQLYNFAFAESSGYGKYSCYMSDVYNNIRYEGSVSKYYAHITKLISIDNRNYINLMDITSNFKVSISGVANDNMIRIGTPGANTYLLSNGIYTIDISNLAGVGNISLGITGDNTDVDITIELLPDYQGALVSDGVDDYGLCENFPILTKENGYTVCAIREYLNNRTGSCSLISNRKAGNEEYAFMIEGITDTSEQAGNFGYPSTITIVDQKFTFQNSKKYNNTNIISKPETNQGNNIIKLFSYFNNVNSYGSYALYSLEIYDRDLTDEEIEKVKTRMIAEYEAKTGNKYTEEIT